MFEFLLCDWIAYIIVLINLKENKLNYFGGDDFICFGGGQTKKFEEVILSLWWVGSDQ